MWTKRRQKSMRRPIIDVWLLTIDMKIFDSIQTYPAVWVSAISVLTVALTIITADKAKTRKNYLSDLMLEDRSSRIFMTIGMIVASFLTPLTIINFNNSINNQLYLFSWLVLAASFFFIVTPIFLWINRYDLHLVSIRVYFVLAFLAEFLIVLYVGKFWWFFLSVVLLNFALTFVTLSKGSLKWLPEVIFFVLTLVYLCGLNWLTLQN